MKIANQLAKFVVETKFMHIPSETVEFMKGLALKTTAGMLSGSVTLAGRRTVKYVKEQRGPPEAGVIGCGFRTSVGYAALADGVFCHAAELEDDTFPSAVSDITIFPVVFPLAEKLRLSGKEVIEASAVGTEVMVRVGLFDPGYLGFVSLPFYGVVGAAATAAKALGLDVEETEAALGIAMSQSSSLIMNFGTDVHYLESAVACSNGIMAAALAKEGMTSNPDIEKWLTDLLGKERVALEKITEGLGKPRWHVHDIWIKKYPCCFLIQRQIDALLALLKEHSISYEQIERVEVDVGPRDTVCDRPNPKDIEDSKFSYQHVLAGAMLEGDVDSDTCTDEKIVDPKFKEGRSKVKVTGHPDWPAEYQAGPGTVTVALKDGGKLVKEMEQPIGGPKLPLTTEKLVALYKKYSQGVLSEELIEWTGDVILNLEKHKDVQELMDVLTFRYAIRR